MQRVIMWTVINTTWRCVRKEYDHRLRRFLTCTPLCTWSILLSTSTADNNYNSCLNIEEACWWCMTGKITKNHASGRLIGLPSLFFHTRTQVYHLPYRLLINESTTSVRATSVNTQLVGLCYWRSARRQACSPSAGWCHPPVKISPKRQGTQLPVLVH